MELEYNGVTLELLTLDRVHREAVYTADQTDLLYVRWVIGASCVFASGGYPVATSVKSVSQQAREQLYGGSPQTNLGVDPPAPSSDKVSQRRNVASELGAAGYNGVETDVEVKSRLWTPRGKLKISAYDTDGKKVTWLESPRPGFSVDAANGPRPLAVDVVSATGDAGTLGVYFQIETCLPPCPNGSDRLVLSHRWQMTHEHDSNYYLTRIIEGEIVFNAAVVAKSGLTPDLVRAQFIHPVPLGFKRGGPRIVASSDGLTIGYAVADTDQTVTFSPGDSGATQLDVQEQYAYESPWGL